MAPPSFFFKRAVLRELPYALTKAKTHPYKIKRDVRSNIVEARFLSSALPREFSAASGVQLALPYRVEQTAYLEANPIDSRFGLMLYDFSPDLGWRQEAHFKPLELRVSLQALAQWHAFFWIGSQSDPRKSVVTTNTGAFPNNP